MFLDDVEKILEQLYAENNCDKVKEDENPLEPVDRKETRNTSADADETRPGSPARKDLHYRPSGEEGDLWEKRRDDEMSGCVSRNGKEWVIRPFGTGREARKGKDIEASVSDGRLTVVSRETKTSNGFTEESINTMRFDLPLNGDWNNVKSRVTDNGTLEFYTVFENMADRMLEYDVYHELLIPGSTKFNIKDLDSGTPVTYLHSQEDGKRNSLDKKRSFTKVQLPGGNIEYRFHTGLLLNIPRDYEVLKISVKVNKGQISARYCRSFEPGTPEDLYPYISKEDNITLEIPMGCDAGSVRAKKGPDNELVLVLDAKRANIKRASYSVPIAS